MRFLRQLVVACLVLLLTLPAGAFAQERHVIDPAMLAAMLDQHAAREDADRAEIREALERPEVREVATRIGIDLNRIKASIATLDDSDLRRVAAGARQVNQSFVGGASTVVISTTTIIIALLVVILLVVALK